MNRRRLLVVVVLLALTVAIGVVSVNRAEPAPPARFSSLGGPTTPYVPLTDRLTSTFYCPGVPANGDGTGGHVVVVNPTDAALDGEISTFGSSGPLATLPFEVAPRATVPFDLGAQATEGYVAALVEVRGAGALVEQQAVLPQGTSVAPCANDASTQWVLAAGSTLDDRYQLILSNPYPDAAVVDLEFTTATDSRSPNEFQNYVVPGRAVRVIDVDQVARDEERLSLTVTSRRGRLVLGRALRFSGSARAGASVALAAAGPARQWLFADGEVGEGITDTYTIVNTGEQTASVDVTLFPAEPPLDSVVAPISTEVAPGRTVVVAASSLDLGFTGRYGASVAAAGDQTIVVEHEITRPDSGTAVSLGARFGSLRWWVPIGVGEPTAASLVVFNASGLSGSVTVSALGPGGTLPLPGLENVALGSAATVTLDLTGDAIGVPLLVESSDLSLVVEQRFPAGKGRRSGGLGVPE